MSTQWSLSAEQVVDVPADQALAKLSAYETFHVGSLWGALAKTLAAKGLDPRVYELAIRVLTKWLTVIDRKQAKSIARGLGRVAREEPTLQGPAVQLLVAMHGQRWLRASAADALLQLLERQRLPAALALEVRALLADAPTDAVAKRLAPLLSLGGTSGEQVQLAKNRPLHPSELGPLFMNAGKVWSRGEEVKRRGRPVNVSLRVASQRLALVNVAPKWLPPPLEVPLASAKLSIVGVPAATSGHVVQVRSGTAAVHRWVRKTRAVSEGAVLLDAASYRAVRDITPKNRAAAAALLEAIEADEVQDKVVRSEWPHGPLVVVPFFRSDVIVWVGLDTGGAAVHVILSDCISW